MKSIEERLAEANPHTAGYVPANYEQMVAGAMRHPRHADTTWKTFRARMAGAVAAASAVTVLGVSALNGAGAALPVLGFAATTHSSSPSAQGLSSTSGTSPGAYMMPVRLNYSFHGGDSFSHAGGSARVYDLAAPSDLAATLGGVAKALSVTLATAPDSGNSSTYYGVGGSGYSGDINVGSGADYWNVSAAPNGVAGVSGVTGATSATGPTGASASVAATGSLATQALGFVRALGDYSAGQPVLVGSDAKTSTVDVPLLINGDHSDMSDTFTFNSDGSLQSASGYDFVLNDVATYPLISESAGVDQITAQQSLFRHFLAYSALAPSTTAAGAAPTSGATGPTGTTTIPVGPSGVTGTTGPATVPVGPSGVTGPKGPTAPPTVATTTDVNLTAVSTSYASYEMKGGVWMELPVYDYTGTVDKGNYQDTFTVVPLPSQYLNFAVDTNPLPMGAR